MTLVVSYVTSMKIGKREKPGLKIIDNESNWLTIEKHACLYIRNEHFRNVTF